MTDLPALARYDAACRAVAEARSVDEVLLIHDQARALAAAARVAKNRDLEADCIEMRLRAARRLDELRLAQKETIGLNQGAAAGGKKDGPRGSLVNPRDVRPTLASQGIDKALAHQARVLGAMTAAAFERKVAEARGSVSRVFRRAVREAEIAQEREERRARTALGGSVNDLEALIASGFRAGVIAIDPPWPFETHSERSGRAVTEHYELLALDRIKALPVRRLAADDCAVIMWATWPFMPVWAAVLEAWGVTYSGLALDWVKLNPNGDGLHWGTGYGTRANPEPCILARIGSQLRLSADVHSVIMAPVGAHSEKPDEAYLRMEKLYAGPYLELFGRKPREHWTTWGDELPPLMSEAARMTKLSVRNHPGRMTSLDDSAGKLGEAGFDTVQALALREGVSLAEAHEFVDAAIDVITWREGRKPPDSRVLDLAQAMVEHERRRRETRP